MLVLNHEWNEANEAPPDFFASIRFLRSIRGYLSIQLPLTFHLFLRASPALPMPRRAQFRPCIDLHEGRVKQIVGGTLDSSTEALRTNFVSDRPASWFAARYAEDRLRGGHVIQLGPGNTEAACDALAAYPGGLQLGGGITAENAAGWLEAGASHVIATSFLFDREGRFQDDRLAQLLAETGRERLVIDLSCRRREAGWIVAMNRWQTLTDLAITPASEPREIVRVAEISARNDAKAIAIGHGARTNIVPAPVATPLPPRKPRNTGKICPKNASTAQPTRRAPGRPAASWASAGNQPAISTGMAPLSRSSAKTIRPNLRPSTRPTLVAPMLPLPFSKMFTPRARAIR